MIRYDKYQHNDINKLERERTTFKTNLYKWVSLFIYCKC